MARRLTTTGSVRAAARRNIRKAQVTRIRWREPEANRRVNRVLRSRLGLRR